METLIVKVKESEQLDYVLSLLRGLPYVEVEIQEETTFNEASRAQEFLKTAGQWADRDLDAADLRQRAWTRGNSGS